MMKIIYKILAVSGLLLTVVPAFMHYAGTMTEESMKAWVLGGMIVWFVGAAPWLGRKSPKVEG